MTVVEYNESFARSAIMMIVAKVFGQYSIAVYGIGAYIATYYVMFGGIIPINTLLKPIYFYHIFFGKSAVDVMNTS